MANVRLAQATNQAAMNAVVDRIDLGTIAAQGTIQIYDGAQPATADTAVTTQTLLAELPFSNPAFGNSDTSGVATAAAITNDSSANASGTATWARITDRDGNTVFDCDVNTTGATINLNTINFTLGDTVSITSFTMTHPSGV